MLHLVDHEPAKYPALASRTRKDGVVKVRVVVDAKGTVIKTSQLTGHPLLIQMNQKRSGD